MIDNLESKQIKNAVDFSNLLENRISENFRNLVNLSVDFRTIYEEEAIKLPYHINLIDELHADENAHSRIFAKLLRYQENFKYLFLEQFLNNVCKFNLCIEKPKVEKVDSCGRIDIPIFDKKYVVVIENKVTDKARDQNNSNGGQLAKYIETIKNNYGRKLEEIYVIYTPKYTRELSVDCWKNKNNFSYLGGFEHRFQSLSYRDVIYPWLKNDILPNIDKANIYLYSAVEQYIDHLEGMFNLRIINKKMNMRLQEFIKRELGVQDDKPEDAIAILSEKETELYNAIDQIQQLKSEYKKQIMVCQFEQWKKLLKIDFPNIKVVGDNFKLKNDIINIGVQFSIENQNFVAIIECNDCNKPNIYFGIGMHFVSAEKFKVYESLQKILSDNELGESDNFWYGWKYTTVENAYLDLKTLIDKIQLNV